MMWVIMQKNLQSEIFDHSNEILYHIIDIINENNKRKLFGRKFVPISLEDVWRTIPKFNQYRSGYEHSLAHELLS